MARRKSIPEVIPEQASNDGDVPTVAATMTWNFSDAWMRAKHIPDQFHHRLASANTKAYAAGAIATLLHRDVNYRQFPEYKPLPDNITDALYFGLTDIIHDIEGLLEEVREWEPRR